jgi:hypothetical protein
MLYEVSNSLDGKVYCGPMALAAITGLDTATIVAKLKDNRRRVSGNPTIRGTRFGELAMVASEFGWSVEHIKTFIRNPPTLAGWAKTRDRDTAYLIAVTGHWVALKGHWFCDTRTCGVPVRFTKAPHRRKRVESVFRVRYK